VHNPLTAQGTEHVTEHVVRLLHSLAKKPAGTKQIMQSLRLRHRPTFYYDYLQPSLNTGLVEMTQPSSPKSPTQKYRLTEKGRAWLARARKGEEKPS
jgi:ATP-dependent DNA helicase RecG